jgi:uncharacterized protein
MPRSEARVRTEKADPYANRLCKHFAHKIRAEWPPPKVEVPELGTCRLTANPEELVLTAESPDAEKLASLEEVVGSRRRRRPARTVRRSRTREEQG